MFLMLTLYFHFLGAKNVHVLQVLILGSEGCWRFLTGVCHLNLELDIVTGFGYTNVPKFGALEDTGGS